MEFGVHVMRPVGAREISHLIRAGLQRVTVPLSWRWIERQKGNLDFASVDHFIEPLVHAGIPLQGALGPGFTHLIPDWMLKAGGADSGEYIERFTLAAARTAEHITAISVFRIEDELNGAWLWDGLRTRRRRAKVWRDPAFAARLLRATLDAVHDVRPDAELRVTANAGLPGWRRQVRGWVDAGCRFDRLGLTVQPCMLLPDPAMAERLGEAVEQAAEVLASSGASRPAGRTGAPSVEISRVGYKTKGRLFTPRRQREFLALAAESAGQAGAAGMHWEFLRDQAHPDPMLGYWTPPRERLSGLLHYDSTSKPAMGEMRVLASGGRPGGGL